MNQLLSPKQVAEAIGVSESSLKRWCDQGVVPTERTAGGHRRLRVGDVLRWMKDNDHHLERPEMLGLPPGTAVGKRNRDRSHQMLVDALAEGNFEVCRRIVFNCYLAGGGVAELCDQLLTPVMHAIGDQWECGDLEVYQEHRACEVLARLVHELRLILPTPCGLVALGATPPGDHYRLATSMVEVSLVDLGWRATSLGTSLPFFTLTKAVERHQPALFWMSASHLDDRQQFVREFQHWLADVPPQTTIVVGGREFDAELVAQFPRVQTCTTFAELTQLAAGLANEMAVEQRGG